MAKTKLKTAWFCRECGNETPKWEGKCPSCGAWNSLVEERVATSSSSKSKIIGVVPKSEPVTVSNIRADHAERISMPSAELNRVLGGGLVAGSMVLLGGEPGIGKSTLVLQNILAIKSRTILYVSGEESASQIKMRADRLGRGSDNVFVVTETSLQNIFEHIERLKPGIIIIDSIQTIASDELESAPGSVSQVRECAARLLTYAKTTATPVIVIGHITKDGTLAGPKVLEHIVDAVLQFEGDSKYMFRILRAIKNRFGSTNELGIYEMCRTGLREVANPSEMLISANHGQLSGITLGVTLEGARPLIVEAQALVSTAAYGTPQRTVTGFDTKRLNMLLAVLEKRVGFKLAAKDVFLNIAGGLRINDPAIDLAVTCAVLSSNIDTPVPSGWIMMGEVGLSGELRPVTRPEQRIREAERLGVTDIIVPAGNLKGVDTKSFTARIHQANRIEDAMRSMFG